MKEKEIEKILCEVKISYAIQYKNKDSDEEWRDWSLESSSHDFGRLKRLRKNHKGRLLFRQIRFETVRIETEITQ